MPAVLFTTPGHDPYQAAGDNIFNMNTVATKMGTLGGTLCSILFISWDDIGRTFILSAVGAIASFGISILMQRLTRQRKP